MPSPRQIQRALNKGLLPPFYIGCSLVLKCRDKPYTFFWAPSGPGPPRHLGCAARNGSPRARRTPAACPGFGPVLVASWPPGRGLQQPPQRVHSALGQTGLLRLGAPVPLPRLFPGGSAPNAALPAGLPHRLLIPSCPVSAVPTAALSLRLGFTGQSCATSLSWGTPRRG